jgi:hypothetical protein
MKTKSLELYSWQPSGGEYIAIDWPKVHKTLGVDQTEWLLKQPHTACQLIIEHRADHCKLIAEFYDAATLTLYHLMWAK